jgi:hypothetical protein
MGQLSSHSVFRNSFTTSLLRRSTLLLAIGFTGLSGPGSMSGVSAQTNEPAPRSAQPAVRAINSRTAHRLQTRYVGDDGARQLLEAKQANPLALAAADFDEDGVPDLVSGYAAGGAGVITLHRGNIDAIFPNTPDAKRRKATGRFSDSPFLPVARAFAAPAAPDFLHTGDFDADGHSDVLAAAQRGGALLLRGDGKGGLNPAEHIELPGAVTAVAVGDMNRHDGLPDVVFGIARPEGPQVLLFAGRKGALKSAPEAFDLPSNATSLALGDLDDDHFPDLAVAAESELLVIHGRGKRSQTEIPVEKRSLPFGARALPPSGAVAALPMRLNTDARDDVVMLREGESAPLVSVTQVGTNFVVTNTNDSGPGSLRQAILDANATDGGAGSTDLITFAIPGPAPHTITPLTPLPAVDATGAEAPADLGSVTIDGTSQPGFAGRPVVELSGAVVGSSGDGLTIKTLNCVVRGLAINRFAAGIRFSEGEFLEAQNGRVEGNHLGTDVSGTVDLGNGVGVVARNLFRDVGPITIGGTVAAARNIISGNGRGIEGVVSTVQGNFIGTDVTGTVRLGNDSEGILIGPALPLIGGTAPGARNIISGNGAAGIRVFDDVAFDIINNYIGIDVSGTRALGNAGNGIEVPFQALGTIAGNVISANGGHGVLVNPVGLIPVDVVDNRVGTNSAGTEALGNVRSGLWLIIGSSSVTGNVVSGNGEHGVVLRELDNTVQGNYIGTDITGTAALGNGGDGLRLSGFGHTIGGLDSGQGNVIAFNGGDGLTFPPFGGVTPILSNAIFSNGGLGIDLRDDGVTPNDACDPDTGVNDTGVNELQNFPVLTAVDVSGSSTTIQGQLNSIPSTTYQLQFFSSAAADPSGFGEGARLLGSTMVTTDSACNATFAVTLPVAVSAGHVVTATATSPAMETSEFSNAVAVVAQTPQEATRLLIGQVRDLVAQGDLNRILGLVLEAKLRLAIVFMDRERFHVAIQQLRAFNQLVAAFVKAGKLGAADGQELVDASSAIIADLRSD